MTDIAPGLYEKIMEAFQKRYSKATIFGEPIQNIEATLRTREALFRDADIYAVEVGTMLSEAMKEVLVLDELPNKTLYYNIAEKTIGKSLQESYRLVSSVAGVIQEEINGRAGIGMKPVKPEMNMAAIEKIIDRAAHADTQEKLDSALTEPVNTYPRTVVDDTIKANAKVQSEAGLEVKVERKYDGVGVHNRKDPCEWCLARQGSWTYPDAMEAGVFERHDGCGCIIDYTSKKGERSRSTDKWGFRKIEHPERVEQNTNQWTKKRINARINSNRVIKKPTEEKYTYGEPVRVSVGAKVAGGFSVTHPVTGEELKLIPGKKPIYPRDHLIAGKGTKKEIRKIKDLLEIGGDRDGWKHEKAYLTVLDDYGEEAYVEVHWFECKGVTEKIEQEVKMREGEVFFYDIEEWESKWKW